jgi:hypothetical protein
VTRFPWIAPPRRRGLAGLVAAVIGVLAGGYFVVSALAASSPVITVAFPASGDAYNAAAWAAGCSPAGICGTASASAGLSSVTVSIEQESTGDYWNGSSFVSGPPIFGTAAGTTSWSYGFTPPTDGSYFVDARVTDQSGGRADAFLRFHYGNTASDSSIFGVGGNLSTPLYPGTSEPLDMTFTNPSSSPITIGSADLTGSNISISTSQAGCGSSNFHATGLGTKVTIPAHQFTPTSLSALNVPQADWPVITMIDTNTNQDACEGATLTLTYSGIEASGS